MWPPFLGSKGGSKRGQNEVFVHILEFASFIFAIFAYYDRWAWCLATTVTNLPEKNVAPLFGGQKGIKMRFLSIFQILHHQFSLNSHIMIDGHGVQLLIQPNLSLSLSSVGPPSGLLVSHVFICLFPGNVGPGTFTELKNLYLFQRTDVAKLGSDAQNWAIFSEFVQENSQNVELEA